MVRVRVRVRVMVKVRVMVMDVLSPARTALYCYYNSSTGSF